MKLYVDCTRGLSSDMLVAALLDCFEKKDAVLHELGVNIANNMILTSECANSYERTGLLFRAKRADFNSKNEHAHHGYSMKDVREFIDATGFSSDVKRAAEGVYGIIADAECRVHMAPIDGVHFHEVGQPRAVAAIVCACALMDMLAPEDIVFSHINTGHGTVLCAHGEVSVPAPATKLILKDIPCFFDNDLSGELCTPTGAAIAKYFARKFLSEDEFEVVTEKARAEGLAPAIGIGTKDIGVANGVCVWKID